MLQYTKKYTDHDKKEIELYLQKVKEQIEKGNFIIPNNSKRVKNKEFIEKYRLNVKKQKEMILLLDVLDFCYSANDYNNPNERLYIFLKEYHLDNWGIKEKISTYIKIALKDNDLVVVISLHEPEKRIKKLFV